MTEIANGCPLGDYSQASQIAHMTAPSPLGPWSRRGIALAGFAHNPQAVVAPNGSVLLFHSECPFQPSWPFANFIFCLISSGNPPDRSVLWFWVLASLPRGATTAVHLQGSGPLVMSPGRVCHTHALPPCCPLAVWRFGPLAL